MFAVLLKEFYLVVMMLGIVHHRGTQPMSANYIDFFSLLPKGVQGDIIDCQRLAGH